MSDLIEQLKAKLAEIDDAAACGACIDTQAMHDALLECVVALEYYKQFAHLPEHVQLKERIGGGKAYEALANLKRVVEE